MAREPAVLKGSVETTSSRAACPPRPDVDRLAREGAGDRRRAVDRGEDEVAGVEEMRRAAAQLAGAASQRARRGADAHPGPPEPALQRVGAAGSRPQSPRSSAPAPPLQFGQPVGEAMGGGAQLFEAALQPGRPAGKAARPVFEPRAAGGEAA